MLPRSKAYSDNSGKALEFPGKPRVAIGEVGFFISSLQYNLKNGTIN